MKTPLPIRVPSLLSSLLYRVGGAIDFWTIVCISERELGDVTPFLDAQWNTLHLSIQELRAGIAEDGFEATPTVQEQVAKLMKLSADVRETFDVLGNFRRLPLSDLEPALLRLRNLWQDLKLRVGLLAAVLPLDALPAVNADQDAYLCAVLDGLFDRFEAAHPDSQYVR